MQDVQRYVYIVVGIACAAFGVYWVLQEPSSAVTYKPVEGISVFAVLYLIAQGAERVSEWVIDLLSLLPDSPENKKQVALRDVRAANSTLNGNPGDADFAAVRSVSATKTTKEADADESRLAITFLAHGLSFAFCALAVNWLNYGLLKHIGSQGVDADLDRLLTALAAAGGTKALHELIGRMQKTKESAEAGE